MSDAAITSPVVLITGTSSGVGLASAVAASRAGFTTVATARDPDTAADLRAAADQEGAAFDVRRLDITEAAAVEETVAAVVSDHGRLDAVVNNAGVGSVGTLEWLSMEQIRAAFEVNFFGTIAVSRAALPHLRASCGRLITVGSGYGAVGNPFNEPYCAAKGAVEVYYESLAPVAAEVGVRVCIIESGPVSSRFVANIPVDRVALRANAGPYLPAFENYMARIPAMIAEHVQTPEQVAGHVLAALTDPAPPLRVQTSAFTRDFVAEKLSDLDGSAVVSGARRWLNPASAEVAAPS